MNARSQSVNPPRSTKISTRARILLAAALATTLIGTLYVLAGLTTPADYAVDPMTRLQPPSLAYPLGTDLLGRDMLWRTLDGIGLSLTVGMLAASLSVLIACVMAVLASMHRWAERFVLGATELTLGLPHLVLLLMIAYALGGGISAVIFAIAVTHWPRLSRLLAAETQRLMAHDAVMVSRKLGRSQLWIGWYHIAPHLWPHLLVGFVVMFPHAILHEAGLSFLGMGAQPHEPSIGILLAESLNGLSAGFWWLAVFPGLMLVVVAGAFEVLGNQLQRLTSLRHAQS